MAAVNSSFDFNQRPFVAIWEMTQACDLACVHCRACAKPSRSPGELTTDEARRLIDQIAAMEVPVFVLTGGDPLKRPDVFDLVGYATEKNVRISVTPSATPLLTREAIVRLKDAGLARLAVSLDGPTAQVHDAFRQVPGSFQWTMNAVRWARECGLPVQINTTITRHNLEQVPSTIALLETLNISLWSVFFLVPTGRGKDVGLLSAEEFEQVFEMLYEASRRVLFDIKSTEAQHYRRYLLQKRTDARRQGATPGQRMPHLSGSVPAGGVERAPRGINDGKGFVFISHSGEVFPSGFLPLAAGSIRHQPLAAIYRESPLFRALRMTDNLEGKCGICEFREICGGSRARAFAVTGNAFAEEPCCVYQPKKQAAEALAR